MNEYFQNIETPPFDFDQSDSGDPIPKGKQKGKKAAPKKTSDNPYMLDDEDLNRIPEQKQQPKQAPVKTTQPVAPANPYSLTDQELQEVKKKDGGTQSGPLPSESALTLPSQGRINQAAVAFQNKKLTLDDVDVLAQTDFGRNKGFNALTTGEKKLYVDAYNGDRKSNLVNQVKDIIDTHYPMTNNPAQNQVRGQIMDNVFSGDQDAILKLRDTLVNDYQQKINDRQGQVFSENLGPGTGGRLLASAAAKNDPKVKEMQAQQEAIRNKMDDFGRINLIRTPAMQGWVNLDDAHPAAKTSVAAEKLGKEIEKLYGLSKTTGNTEYERMRTGFADLITNLKMEINDLVADGLPGKNPELMKEAKKKFELVNRYIDQYNKLDTEQFPDVGLSNTYRFLGDVLTETKPNRIYTSKQDILDAAKLAEKKYGFDLQKYGQFIGAAAESPGLTPRGGFRAGLERGTMDAVFGLGDVADWFLPASASHKEERKFQKEQNPIFKGTAASGGFPTKVIYDKEGKTFRELPNEHYGKLDWNNSFRWLGESLPTLAEWVALDKGVGGLAKGIGETITLGLNESKLATGALKEFTLRNDLLPLYESMKVTEGAERTAGLIGATYLTSYNTNRELADQLIEDNSSMGESKKNALASLLTLTTAAAFKAVDYSPSALVEKLVSKSVMPDAIKMLEKESWETLSNEQKASFFKEVVLPRVKAFAIQGAENIKGGAKVGAATVIDQRAKDFISVLHNPDKATESTLKQNVQSFVEQTVLMSLVGLPRMVETGLFPATTKDALYMTGLLEPQYTDRTRRLMEEGQLDEAKGNELIAIYKTMAEEVKKAGLATNKDGLPIITRQKRDLAVANFRKRAAEMLKEKNKINNTEAIQGEADKQADAVLAENYTQDVTESPAFQSVVEGDTGKKPASVDDIKPEKEYIYKREGETVTSTGAELINFLEKGDIYEKPETESLQSDNAETVGVQESQTEGTETAVQPKEVDVNLVNQGVDAIAKAIEQKKIPNTYAAYAEAKPKDFLQLVADQALGFTRDPKGNRMKADTPDAESSVRRSYGNDVVDIAMKLYPDENQDTAITSAGENAPIAAEDNIHVQDLIDQPVTYKGQRGQLSLDNKAVIFKAEGKAREYEIGPIGEVALKTAKELGIEQEKSVVKVDDNGDIVVRDKAYKNLFSDPFQAINYDKEGNVVSVNLETADGKKRTFRGPVAEDIAYEIHLQEISKRNEQPDFERFLNEDEDARQTLHDARLAEASQERTNSDTGEVSKGATGKEQVPATGKTGRVEADISSSSKTTENGNQIQEERGRQEATKETQRQNATEDARGQQRDGLLENEGADDDLAPSIIRRTNELLDKTEQHNRLSGRDAKKARLLNDIRLEANELGLKVDYGKGYAIIRDQNNKKVYRKSEINNSTPAKNFDVNSYSQETRNFVDLVKENPDLILGVGVEGIDGRYMSEAQKQNAIKQLAKGNITNGVKSVYDAIDKMTETGMIELRDNKTGERVGIPIEDYKMLFVEEIKPLTDDNILELNSMLGEDIFDQLGNEAIDNIIEGDQNEQGTAIPKEAEQPAERPTNAGAQATGSGGETAATGKQPATESKEPVAAPPGEPPGPPKEPPPPKGKEPVAPTGDEAPKEREYSMLRRLMDSENVPDNIKEGFRKKGLTYKVSDQAEARQAAKGILETFGVDDSLTQARKGVFDGSVSSAIYAEAIDHYYDLSTKATTPEEKQANAQRWADIYNEYNELANQAGKFNAQIYNFYRVSKLGFVLAARDKYDKAREKVLLKDEKDIQSAFDALMDTPEFKELFGIKVQEAAGKVKFEIKKEQKQKISDFFDKLKIDTNRAGAYLLPPQLYNGAIEAMKRATLLGYDVADIIKEGIEHIKSRHKEDWDVESFKKDFQPRLEDMVKKLEPKGDKVLKGIKTRLTKEIQSLTQQIDAGERKVDKKGNVEYDAEAQALKIERDRLKDLLESIVGKPEMSDEQRLNITKKAMERSIAEYERRIKEQDISKKKGKDAVSDVELEAMKERRDALKDEYEEMKDVITEPERLAKMDQKEKERILKKWEKRLDKLDDGARKELLTSALNEIVKNGGLEYDTFRQMYADSLGLPSLTPDVEARLMELGGKLDGVTQAQNALQKDPSQANIDAFLKAMQDGEGAAREINDLLGAKGISLDRFLSIMRLNTLGVANLVLNPFFNIWYQPIRFLQSLIKTGLDYGLDFSGISKNDGLKENVFYKQRGYYKRFGEGLMKSFKGFVSGESNLDLANKSVRQNIQPLESIKDIMKHYKGEQKLTKSELANAIVEAFPTMGMTAAVIGRGLQVGDLPFRFAAEGAEAENIARQMGLKGMEKEAFILSPDEASAEKIKEAGERAVMQQSNMISRLQGYLTGWGKSEAEKSALVKTSLGVSKVLGAATQPFLKIPLNSALTVFELAVPEYTLVMGVVKAVQGDRSAALDYFSKAAVGISIGYAFSQMAAAGVLGGGGDEREKWKQNTYLQQYTGINSINFSGYKRWLRGGDSNYQDGDVILNLNWLGVPGALMQLHATKYDNLTPQQYEKQKADEGLASSYIDELGYRVQHSFVNGLKSNVFGNTSTLLAAMDGNPTDVNNWVTSTVNVLSNSFDPNWLAQFGKLKNPYKPDYSAMPLTERIASNFKDRFFAGSDLPSQITVWGDKKKDAPKGIDPYAWYFLDITKHQNVDTSDFGYNIAALFHRTKDKNVIPAKPDKGIVHKKESIKLKPKEYEQLQILVGRNRKSLVQALMSTDEYNNGTDEEKINLLKKQYSEGYKLGKDEYVSLHPELDK